MDKFCNMNIDLELRPRIMDGSWIGKGTFLKLHKWVNMFASLNNAQSKKCAITWAPKAFPNFSKSTLPITIKVHKVTVIYYLTNLSMPNLSNSRNLLTCWI